MKYTVDYAHITKENFRETHSWMIPSITQKGGPTVRTWMDLIVPQRMVLRNGCLEMTKLGSEGKDVWRNYAGLNPRVEICTPKLVAKLIPITIDYVFKIPKEPEYYAIIFQLMDREDNGIVPIPTFQLIVRHQQLNVRYAAFKPDGTRGELVYCPIMPMVWDQFLTVKITGTLDVKGSMKVFVNGVEKWSKSKYKSGSTCKDNVKMAYGVYGYPGKDMTNIVKYISYST